MSSNGPKPDLEQMVADTLGMLDNHIPALTPQRLRYDRERLLRLRNSPLVDAHLPRQTTIVSSPTPRNGLIPRAKL